MTTPPTLKEQAETWAGPHSFGCRMLLPGCICGAEPRARAIESALLAAEERGRRQGLMAAANKLDKADYGPVYKMPGAVVPNALDYAARLVRALLPQPETKETK